MATDKRKNIPQDANADDATTAELPVLNPRSARFAEKAEADADADANTIAFDDPETGDESLDSLHAELRSRDERIVALQIDAEHLRSRCSGLEKEITAREELTRILQQDLRSASKKRLKTDKLLQKIERKKNSLNTRLGKLQQRSSAEDIRTEVSKSSALRKQLKQAQIVAADLQTYIDGRKQTWDQLDSDIETYKVTLSSKDAERTKLEKEKTDVERDLVNARNKIGALHARLTKEQTSAKKLRKKNSALKRDIGIYQSDNALEIEQHLAEQSGRLVSNKDEIAELRGQLLRSERYADELRDSRRDLEIASAESHAERQQFATSLKQATGQVFDLREQLDAEKLLTADLEKEARQIRFELGTAQDTIGDCESVNGQLASNLIENTQFRQALEEQLNVSEEQLSRDTSRLEKKVRRLDRQLEDSDRKITNKDAAISALLSELASKSQAIEAIGEPGDAVHEIDDRMAERSQVRDRPTRLLIGTIDGQELQFPLFKDRLTIGRTVQNDIQLNVHSISRRHAVILIDEDGPRIVDWGSKNGISVNGRKVSEQFLHHGDKVRIGMAEFVFEERPKR